MKSIDKERPRLRKKGEKNVQIFKEEVEGWTHLKRVSERRPLWFLAHEVYINCLTLLLLRNFLPKGIHYVFCT